MLSWILFGSIVRSQDTLPPLKNIDFSKDIRSFWKDRLFIFKDGRGSVLDFVLAHFGSSWGSLGGLLGDLCRLLGVSWRPLGASDPTPADDTH